ncbi:UPF0481 protein At3g47200-like [Rhododendron vialii]|uniref:UPF0481 protein At3g47200-like n=1 Tax=Rhododendron vialii TaxID=182163 RepID=UPI00265D82D8|nr:UPF0481 protein At3g47200-like [Rhododendron vialii]
MGSLHAKTQNNPKSGSPKKKRKTYPKQGNCFLDCIDQKRYFHSTKMSQGGNDDKQAPKILTKTLGEKFNDGTGKIKSLYSFARIYKVPEDLRKLNECAYVPRLIAIGPLHWKGEHLQKPMQDVKMDYANRLFLRLTKGIADPKIRDEKDKLLQECVEKMKKFTVKAKKYDTEEEVTLVDMAKKCYAEELDLSDDEMMEMMLVDGCFILELLYVYYHTNYCQASSSISQPINGGESGGKSNSTGCEKARADPIFDSILTATLVKQDLILLQNQIPFFVLEHLFKLTVAMIPVDQATGCPPPMLSLADYVRSYFSKFLSLEGGPYSGTMPKTSCCLPIDHCLLSVCGSTKEIEQGKTESGKANDYYHILHFLHSSYIPGEQGKDNEHGGNKRNSTLHSELTISASDLHYAGVEFVPSKDLFDVEFINKGIFGCSTLEFRIPAIYIRNNTESFLRNVIALEQCSPGVPRYFTSYAKLMDMFINSEEDVRVLINKKVIHNYLSTDKDVCDLFNKLCKEVVLEDFHFDEECRKASRYNNDWRTRTVKYVTRLFVASPWPVIGFFMGIVTFAIAVYKFGYSIDGRFRP